MEQNNSGENMEIVPYSKGSDIEPQNTGIEVSQSGQAVEDGQNTAAEVWTDIADRVSLNFNTEKEKSAYIRKRDSFQKDDAEAKRRLELRGQREKLGLPQVDDYLPSISGTAKTEKDDLGEMLEKSEIPTEHEKYHTQESEKIRHGIIFDPMIENGKMWAMVKDTHSLFDPSQVVSASNEIHFDMIIQQQERDFEESLKNPGEQEARKRQRENVIEILDRIYNNLNHEAFKDPDPNIRQSELMRVLNQMGIKFENQEMQALLEEQYFKFNIPNQDFPMFKDHGGVIENKDEFIENGLIYFDPYIFAEAQQNVLGQAKPIFTGKKVLDAAEHLSNKYVSDREEHLINLFKSNIERKP